MATNSNQTSQQDTDEQDNGQAQQQTDDQPQASQQDSASSSTSNPPAQRAKTSPKRSSSGGRRAQSPSQVARLGRLHMAREWRDQGSVYEAIHAYEEILIAYPGTGVAATAVDDLVEMAKKMEAEGQFHSALELYHKLERLGVDR